LRLVWETRKAVKSPIIGLGGVETAEDVLEYLSVGASAVQVGTASFADPRASERLVDTLPNALMEAKTLSVNKLRDRPLAENS
jgi:dihydroorotate dehydrogenase (NAD+) catalytic subunit